MATPIKQVDFTYISPTGEEISESGDLFDIIDVPGNYLFGIMALPPYPILNDYFGLGYYGQPMGDSARWEPFSITRQEYHDLVEYLSADGIDRLVRKSNNIFGEYHRVSRDDFSFSTLDVPAEVRTVQDFSDWKYQRGKWGVPNQDKWESVGMPKYKLQQEIIDWMGSAYQRQKFAKSRIDQGISTGYFTAVGDAAAIDQMLNDKLRDIVHAGWIDPHAFLTTLVALIRRKPWVPELDKTIECYPLNESQPKSLDDGPTNSSRQMGWSMVRVDNHTRDDLAAFALEDVPALRVSWLKEPDWPRKTDVDTNVVESILTNLIGLAKQAQRLEQSIFALSVWR